MKKLLCLFFIVCFFGILDSKDFIESSNLDSKNTKQDFIESSALDSKNVKKDSNLDSKNLKKDSMESNSQNLLQGFKREEIGCGNEQILLAFAKKFFNLNEQELEKIKKDSIFERFSRESFNEIKIGIIDSNIFHNFASDVRYFVVTEHPFATCVLRHGRVSGYDLVKSWYFIETYNIDGDFVCGVVNLSAKDSKKSLENENPNLRIRKNPRNKPQNYIYFLVTKNENGAINLKKYTKKSKQEIFDNYDPIYKWEF